SRKAASSPRRRRCTSPTWRSRTRRTASRPASASRWWATRRSALRSAPELRSMADKEDKKPKTEKAPAGDNAPNPKAERAAEAKADAAAKAAAPKGEREPEPKGPARLRKQFDETIRGKLTEQFKYQNAMQVPRIDKIVLNMGVGEGVND